MKEIEFEKIFLLGNKNSVNLRIKVYKVVWKRIVNFNERILKERDLIWRK